MNRAIFLGGGIVLLCACAPAASKDAIVLDLGDFEDYAEWYVYERGEAPEPKPFEADPLIVTAIGKVRAVPDIAVITATVAAEDENESRAVDSVSQQVNAVQAALADRDVETGFTALSSNPEYDEACQNANRAAQRRANEIRNDYWFNRRLDERGDTETRRRPAKPRLMPRVCQAQAIRVSTNMVIRVSPADEAGDVLRALSDAGAESARLYGYDFSNFDALYQDAAQAAVQNARTKAEAVASGAQGELGEIVDMSVSGPSRVGRFGPQPTVIRPPRPRSGDGISALDSYDATLQDTRRRAAPPPPPPSAAMDDRLDTIIVTGSRMKRETASAPIYVQDVAQNASSEMLAFDGGVVERVIPVVSGSSTSTGSNALTMSLMSGPQTIEVAARLSYAYPTPLDGIVIKEPDESGS